jgi:DNA-binding NarL/FixJ family response regulator
VKSLVLSSYGAGADITRALQAGASGYLVKGMPLEYLLEAIRTIHAGGRYLPPEISGRLETQLNSEISTRELEVLQLIARGKSNKEIAAHLGIVEGTVKAHLARIFTKLGAVDRAQAMAIAVKRDLIQLD